ncbi:hypothetical protein [Lysinibacillus xylanilyticus]|uniref:hypothetical protein n=1 Tax=Lysinibacillus xylanilyticus TaxID=582475 RepID=UPI0038300583
MKKITTALLSSALLISPVAFSSQAEASTLNQGEFKTDIIEVETDINEVETDIIEDETDINEVETDIIEDETDINELVTYAPSEFSIMPRGMEKPGKNASSHDISVSAYNYQVEKVGAQVYTDKFIKGKKSMTVTVKKWDIKTDWGIAKNKLTITLYDSSGKKVSSDSVTMAQGGSDSVSFTGLSASTKYYVMFSVELNKQTYSFNGSIS